MNNLLTGEQFVVNGFILKMNNSLATHKQKNFTKLEAAPRIELGLKDLQSSALPLGYTAFKNLER